MIKVRINGDISSRFKGNRAHVRDVEIRHSIRTTSNNHARIKYYNTYILDHSCMYLI